MEFKGTKGKWDNIKNNLTQEGGYISVGTKKRWWIVEAKGTHVGPETEEEVEANALLISKAPEMWEMLGDISNALKMKGDSDFLIIIDEIDELRRQATEL